MTTTTITLTWAIPSVFVTSLLLITNPDNEAPRHELPTGACILDRFVEVTGGTDAFEKLHNRVRHDRIVHVGMGFEDTAVSYTARPNKRFVEIESEAMGNVKYGTDGNLVWYLPAEGGPMIEEGTAREAQLAESAFDRLENWRAYYDKVESVKETTVEGKACYEVLLTPKIGAAETHFYDRETGLLVGARKTRLSSFMPAIVLDLSFDDYKVVDGIRLPHKVHQKFNQCGSPREMLFVTERIEHNVGLSADRFTPPTRVLAAAVGKEISGILKDPTAESGEEPQSPCEAGATRATAPCGGGEAKAETKKPCCGGS